MTKKYDPEYLQKHIDKAMPRLSKIDNIDDHIAFIKGYDVEEEAAWREAKRLIEVFLGISIKKAAEVWEVVIYDTMTGMAQDNAIKCCNEIIKQWEYIGTYLSDMNGELNPNLKHWQSVKQQIKDFEL